MLGKLGGRKVIFGVMLALLGVAVDIYAPKGLSGNLLELFTYLGIGFFGGNGLEHVAGAVKKPSSLRSKVNTEEIEMSLNAITQATEQLNENTNALIQQGLITQQALSHVIGKG